MNVHARLKVTGIQKHNAECESVTLMAVYSDDPASPNYSFSKFTPYAQFQMSITNPILFGAFEISKEYDVMISPVEEADNA